MEKVNLTTSGTEVKFRLPITKVDEQTRTVSGYATLDNLDKTDDVVTASASERAFSRWRGNIREMHAPLAVGKAVSFRSAPYVDDSGAEYNGIYVDAYISTGAEPTWQKVLDGTLSGFSIGGGVLKYETKVDVDSGKNIRVITDYELTELSLVDSPANELANIVSIHKSDGAATVTGMANELELLNVYTDGTEVWVSAGESLDKSFEYIGWVEDNDDKISQIRTLLKSKELGGSNMPEVEKAENVTEVETVEEDTKPDFEGLFKSFSEDIRGLVQSSIDSTEELKAGVDEVNKSVATATQKIEELETKSTELTERFDDVTKRIKEVEESGGTQKSGTVEKADTVEEENSYISKVFKGKLIPMNSLVQQ